MSHSQWCDWDTNSACHHKNRKSDCDVYSRFSNMLKMLPSFRHTESVASVDRLLLVRSNQSDGWDIELNGDYREAAAAKVEPDKVAHFKIKLTLIKPRTHDKFCDPSHH